MRLTAVAFTGLAEACNSAILSCIFEGLSPNSIYGCSTTDHVSCTDMATLPPPSVTKTPDTTSTPGSESDSGAGSKFKSSAASLIRLGGMEIKGTVLAILVAIVWV